MLATADKAKDYLQDTDKEGFDCVTMAHTHMIGDSKQLLADLKTVVGQVTLMKKMSML